jgi:formylglycine-generating enzyme required for sulfatase activity
VPEWIPPDPEKLAQLLPQYRIERLIGQGGMGAVYQAVQLVLERPVAIKVLPAELGNDEEFVARFLREARTLAKLPHPGIVAIYELGRTSEGHLFFVMEFIDGADLAQLMRAGRLAPRQVFEIAVQVCEALQHAHSQDVIHRDLKPANILVTKSGRAKLADFGLARPLKEEGRVRASTLVRGTPDYMAPEQRDGRGDHRSDIYALGVLLYEMLTGRRPKGIFDPPSARAAVDARVDAVVVKALQQEPERRYQLVSEMMRDLERMRATPPRRTRSPIRTAAGVIASGLLLAALIVWFKGRANANAAGRGPAVVAHANLSFAGASREKPFVNSLGMKFVPVPITGGPAERTVFFAVWETRVRDFRAFARDSGYDYKDGEGAIILAEEIWVRTGEASWESPGFAQSEGHPVTCVSWEDARAFCAWLSRQEGNLYRLPSDAEWTCAAGLAGERDATIAPAKRRELPGFPWGNTWPPPAGSGNFAGSECVLGEEPPSWTTIAGFKDPFPRTAPVGTFTANSLGLHDLGGNVREWCQDWYDATRGVRVLRGGAWSASSEMQLLTTFRDREQQTLRKSNTGFRVVLDPAGGRPAAKAGAK